MLDIYETLEIRKVLDEVTSFSKTEIGLSKIKSLKMLSLEEASKALILVKQMSSFVIRYGAIPILSSFDLTTFIDVALKGGVLTALDLDHIATDVLTANKVHSFFKKADKSMYFELTELTNKLYDISELELKFKY